MSDSNKALKEKLLSSRKNGFDRVDAAELEQMEAYCKEYMTFLDAGKTERLCAAETVRLAEQAGYKPLVRGQALKAGDKVYVCNRGKSVLLAHIGDCLSGGNGYTLECTQSIDRTSLISHLTQVDLHHFFSIPAAHCLVYGISEGMSRNL